jgi:phage tail-like protein
MTPDYPLVGYRFLVTLSPGDAYLPATQAALLPLVAGGSFMEVKGLGADLEVLAYPEGGVNDHLHQLPVRHSWKRLSFRTGMVRGTGLWDWYQAGLTQSLGARRDGAIVLMTPLGTPAISWMFQAGLAVSWTGPELNSMNNSVAIEGLDVAHEGLIQVQLSPPGTP